MMIDFNNIRAWSNATLVLLCILSCTINMSCSPNTPSLKSKNVPYNLFALNNTNNDINQCAIYYDKSDFVKMFGILGTNREAGQMGLINPMSATGRITYVTLDGEMHNLKVDFAANRPDDFRQEPYDVYVTVNEGNSIEVKYIR